jgi:hypothetical protein
MNAQKESFEFDLNTFYRLQRTKRPSTSIAVYADLLASMTIQNSPTIDCEVRFLSKTLKMGTHTVTETLNEFRPRLVWKVYTCAIEFTNKSRVPKTRLPLSLAIRKSSPARQFENSPKVSTFRLSMSLGSRYLVIF